MIDKFSHGFINSVYDFNDFTLNELLCKYFSKVVLFCTTFCYIVK